jgi:hypothetical protein
MKTILTFAVSVAVSAMFKTLLRTPTGAVGENAAAEPTRRKAIASFILTRSIVSE